MKKLRWVIGTFGLALAAGWLSGCGGVTPLNANAALMSGNWGLHSSATQAANLPELAGPVAARA